jgi:hypothetical protein
VGIVGIRVLGERDPSFDERQRGRCATHAPTIGMLEAGGT